MFSFIKILNICENNITITFYGDFNKYRSLLKKININYLTDTTIIHEENKKEFFAVICKNQTCSEKLKDINEIDRYLKKLNNV